MPPKARITKEMIVDAGLNVVRTEGAECLNVRRVAAELNCSTQPVMYHYPTVDELRADVYAKADELHTQYIMSADKKAANRLLSIGLRYIRFGSEEKHLFRFLFQSGKFRSAGVRELIDTEQLGFIIKPLSEGAGLSENQAREAFEYLFVCVHGAASLLADNDISYDEEYCTRLLETAFKGVVGVLRGEKK